MRMVLKMTLKPPLIVLLLATFLTTLPHPFSHAADKNPWDSLEKAQTLACRFGPGISTGWKGDEPASEDARIEVEVVLNDIDHQAGRATMISEGQPTGVLAKIYPMGVHFIEMSGMGNIAVLTVYPYFLKGTENYPAVWSRHQYLADGPLASQLYGTCKVQD